MPKLCLKKEVSSPRCIKIMKIKTKFATINRHEINTQFNKMTHKQSQVKMQAKIKSSVKCILKCI